MLEKPPANDADVATPQVLLERLKLILDDLDQLHLFEAAAHLSMAVHALERRYGSGPTQR